LPAKWHFKDGRTSDTLGSDKHKADVLFVDYDYLFDGLGGKYCEDGVKEPDANRVGLYFFESGTTDPFRDFDGHDELKRSGDQVSKDSFEGNIASLVDETLQKHPEWKGGAPSQKAVVNEAANGEKAAVGGEQASIKDTITFLLPDTFKRIFHPRPRGHAIIANVVFWYSKLPSALYMTCSSN